MQHRENWDGDGYSTINGIVKRDLQQKYMLSERTIIMAIITTNVAVNKAASVLEYLERGYTVIEITVMRFLSIRTVTVWEQGVYRRDC